MIVKVKTFAGLREILGGEVSLELEQRATIKDLISPFFLGLKTII